MKYHKKRRFGALVLALAMALSLVAPGWAADPSLSISESSLELEAGESKELTAALSNGPDETTVTVTYKWECSMSGIVTFGSDNQATTTVTAGNATTSTPATITVTASWPDTDNPGNTIEKTDTCTLTIKEKADTNIPVTGVTLNKNSLALETGQSETLTATVQPSNATNQTVTWTSSNDKVAAVKDGEVTGVGAGKATITATAGGETASCEVTVELGSASSVMFSTQPIVWNTSQTNPWTLSVTANGKMDDGDKIEWSVTNQDTTVDEELLPVLVPRGNGLTVSVNNKYPGVYTFSATYVKANGDKSDPVTKEVTISGITLNRRELNMIVGGSAALGVENTFGSAAGGTVATSCGPAPTRPSSLCSTAT